MQFIRVSKVAHLILVLANKWVRIRAAADCVSARIVRLLARVVLASAGAKSVFLAKVVTAQFTGGDGKTK